MKRTTRNLLSVITVVLFIAVFLWFTSNNWEGFAELEIVSAWLLLPILILLLINLFSIGSVMESAIEPYGVKLSKYEIFGLSSITRFSNHISPGYLGASLRAVYIKKNHGVSYAKFSSGFILSNFMQIVISGLLVLVLFFVADNSYSVSLPFAFIAIMLGLLISLILLPLDTIVERLKKRESSNIKLIKYLVGVLDGYQYAKSRSSTLYKIVLWVIISLLSSGVMVFLLYRVLGYDTGFIQSLFISSLGGWGIIFSLTPANLGVREGLMTFGASVMGVSVPATLTLAILIRVVTFSTVALLSLYFAPRLLNTTLTKLGRVQDDG